MKEMLKYGVILGIVCLVSSSVLAVVNAVTEPNIEKQRLKQETGALSLIMPEASVFKPHTKEDKTNYYIAYGQDNKIKGFIIKAEGKGYSSVIEILAGLNEKLEITDIVIISANETPGLGSRVSEPSFIGQFKGKDIASIDNVQAITGATISSSAVIRAVKNYLTQLKPELEKELINAK
jgi:electron transport complex protein RnfG